MGKVCVFEIKEQYGGEMGEVSVFQIRNRMARLQNLRRGSTTVCR